MQSNLILISHRGNIYHPDPDKENHPDQLIKALNKGFNVELDVWKVDDCYALGHDKPQYEIHENFLTNSKFWCHAKNLETINHLIKNPNIHSFYHQNDDCTLTSKGYIWTFPGQSYLMSKSIAVLPENTPLEANISKYNLGGICSDYIVRFSH